MASNLDEFFMVRVAALKEALAEGDTAPDVAGMTPAQQLQRISERAHAMVDELYATLTGEILPPLAERGLKLVAPRRPRALRPAPRSRATSATRCCPPSPRSPSTPRGPSPCWPA